jgi:hypothetical protein
MIKDFLSGLRQSYGHHRCELVLFFFSFGKRKEESHLYRIPLRNFYYAITLVWVYQIKYNTENIKS